MQDAQHQARLASDGTVIGLDFMALLALASARGLDVAAMAELLPALEAGFVEALFKRKANNHD